MRTSKTLLVIFFSFMEGKWLMEGFARMTMEQVSREIVVALIP